MDRYERPEHMEPPVNPLPPVVLALAVPIVLIEAAFELGAAGIVGGPGAIGWRLGAIRDHAFLAELFFWMTGNGQVRADILSRFVTYPFVHASFTHMLMVVVFLLALGKMVGEVFRPWAVLVVFFGAAIAGALAYAPFGGPVPLLGGYPAVYGLIGAFTFLIWTRLAASGGNQMRAFSLIGMLLAIQLVFGLVFGGGNDWVADVAGFAAGFVLSFVVSPGGWARVVDRLRVR